MAPHSGALAWRIPWMEEPCGLQCMGSLRVGHDWVTSLSLSLDLYTVYCFLYHLQIRIYSYSWLIMSFDCVPGTVSSVSTQPLPRQSGLLLSWSSLKNIFGEFLDSPVVRTLYSHFWVPRFNTWWGAIRSLMCLTAKKKKKVFLFSL